MAEEKRPQLRIDPQQFAQEVAAEIAADLGRQGGGTKSQSPTQFAVPGEQSQETE